MFAALVEDDGQPPALWFGPLCAALCAPRRAVNAPAGRRVPRSRSSAGAAGWGEAACEQRPASHALAALSAPLAAWLTPAASPRFLCRLGRRARTRDVFSRPFRQKGFINLTTYLREYRIGDYVDIKVNGAIHKGMPHKCYQGKTGVVWNVTRRAIGVEVTKIHREKQLRKRIHVRVEHVQPSRCRDNFLARRASNDKAKQEAKASGTKISTKRPVAGQPRVGFELVPSSEVETLTAVPYDIAATVK